jgi:hypothetical protein
LRAIAFANGEEIHRLARCWIYGSVVKTDGDEHPFLFVNGGAAMLSNSAFGAAVIRDTITKREIQLLKHTSMLFLVSRGAF